MHDAAQKAAALYWSGEDTQNLLRIARISGVIGRRSQAG